MKRGALLKRKTFRRDGPDAAPSEHPRAKERSVKTCAHCKKPFIPKSMAHTVCSPRCLLAKVREDERARKANAKAERAADRAKREAMKTIHELIAEADREFAAFIRLRDRIAGHPCISSGRPLDWTGNAVDAGHYRSRGAASHLRYHEDNCHAQSKHDNQFKAGNVVQYRINLIARIGLTSVEALEADNRVHKWTREELIAIKSHYRQKRKELEKARGLP